MALFTCPIYSPMVMLIVFGLLFVNMVVFGLLFNYVKMVDILQRWLTLNSHLQYNVKISSFFFYIPKNVSSAKKKHSWNAPMWTHTYGRQNTNNTMDKIRMECDEPHLFSLQPLIKHWNDCAQPFNTTVGGVFIG